MAYHIGGTLEEAGARVVYAVRDPEQRDRVGKLLEDREILVCDVERPEEVARLRVETAARFRPLHGMVHSIAFADYAGGPKAFHETGKAEFLRAFDISCYSLLAVSNALRDVLDPDASVVTISISTTRMASENYGFMAPIKVAHDSSLAFLAKSFAASRRCASTPWAPDCSRPRHPRASPI